MMKRIFLLFIFCASIFCSWAHDFEVDGIYYIITSSTGLRVEVTCRGSYYGSYDNEYSGAVTIPSTVTYNSNTYSVTSIGEEAFAYCSSLTAITIPEGVTSIGEEAFRGCSSLSSITLPEGVTSIGSLAFDGCSSLTSITLPESVTSIGNYAFDGCSSLTSITIPEGVTRIGSCAFRGCSSLTAITIPQSVTSIGSSAFYGCTFSIENFINKSLCTDSSYWGAMIADKDCDGVLIKDGSVIECRPYVTSVTIPEGVTSIGEEAFYGCSSLTSITIPASVKSIGEEAFYGCSSLTSITLPEGVTSIGSSAFWGCSSLTAINIPDGVELISNYVFNNCTSLKRVIINDGTSTLSLGHNLQYSNKLGEGLFYDCPLESVYIGRNLSYDLSYEKGYSPFYDNDNIVEVYIGENVSEIGQNLFNGCDNIQSLTISDKVLSISAKAFSNPTKVIWLTNTPPEGYKYVNGRINYVSNTQYEDLDNVQVYPYLASLFELNGVRYVPVSPSERTCHAIDCAYDASSATINIKETVSFKGVSMKVIKLSSYAFFKNDHIKDVSVSNSVEEVCSFCFSGCSDLENVKIDAKNIGPYVFQNCTNLRKTILCSGVSNIGHYVFEDCGQLSEIVICNRDSVLAIGANGTLSLFADCPLDSVYIGGNIAYSKSPFCNNTTLRTVTMGENIKSIGDNAFYGCISLENVTLGRSLQSIGDNAFMGCISLENVTLGRSLQSIGDEAFSDCCSLTAITSHATIPPTCGIAALDDINKWNCVLKVPIGSVSAYQMADQWKDFFFIEEVATDISPTNLDLHQPKIVYDLKGRRVNITGDNMHELTKGIYILNGRKLLINGL